jgi:hypothetical protein
MKKQVLIFLFLHSINSLEMVRHSNKKSVRFQDNIEEEPTDSASSDYFTFGAPKKKKKSRPSQSKYFKSTIPPKQPPKLKSALKSTNKNPIVIASSSGVKSNGGAFDISSYRSNDPNVKAFVGDASSLNSHSKNGLFDDSDLGPFVPRNPFRNIGPTPQILDAVSPERFWLPPNAPITQNIPGPFLPYSQGVPGQLPAVDNRIRVEEAFLPQVQGLTGPRDFDVPVDPRTPAEILTQTGIAAVDPFVPPYRPPCVITPLNLVTPIPGGNIINPLSPQVNNVRGPFFPDDPRNDGAYLVTADLPPPQLVARDIDDGPYIVERVTDPIVFFDPVQGQTVVFDPLRNFTRLYNPETDPELPLDDPNVNSGIVSETDGTMAIPVATGRTNGGLLKSMSTNGNGGQSLPAFWILKKLEDLNLKDYEKSGGINGQQQQPKAQSRTSNGARGGQIIYQKCDINPLKPAPPPPKPKKQHISIKKPTKIQIGNPEPNPEHIRIQLTTTNPNEDGVGDGHEKSGKIANKENKYTKPSKDEKNNYKVTLVYRPIVDIEIEKRYGGFKANNNNHKNEAGSWPKPSIKIVILSFFIIFFSFFL